MKLHVIAILLVFLAPIALRAAEPGASIRYQLDRDAVVSLNVTRPDGWVVRELLTAWWRSVSADAHANNDIPTEIRLHPAEWGQLRLVQ